MSTCSSLATCFVDDGHQRHLQTWCGRPLGRMLGLAVAVMAAGTTLLMGTASETALLLYLAIGLGVATAIPMLLPDRTAP